MAEGGRTGSLPDLPLWKPVIGCIEVGAPSWSLSWPSWDEIAEMGPETTLGVFLESKVGNGDGKVTISGA